MLLSGVAVVGVVAASMWIFSDNGKVAGQADDEIEDVQVSTKDMMNRNLSEQEWMAQSENRFQSQENQLKSVGGTNAKVAQLSEQIEALLSLIHISEPTRLGMNSYAVFCLKKKTYAVFCLKKKKKKKKRIAYIFLLFVSFFFFNDTATTEIYT